MPLRLAIIVTHEEESMALLGYEGFDHEDASYAFLINKPFGTNTQVGSWATLNAAKTAGLLGGFALNSTSNQTLTLATNYSRLIAGFRLSILQFLNTPTNNIFQWLDGSTVQCGIGLNSAGILTFWRGNSGTV